MPKWHIFQETLPFITTNQNTGLNRDQNPTNPLVFIILFISLFTTGIGGTLGESIDLDYFSDMGAGASGGLGAEQAAALADEAVLYASGGGARLDGAAGKMLRSLARMRKAGVPLGACVQRAQIEDGGWRRGLSQDHISRFVAWCQARGQITSADIAMAFPGAAGAAGAAGVMGGAGGVAGGAPARAASLYNADIRVLEKYRLGLGGRGVVVADNAEFASIPESRRELIRQAFAGPEGNIFANLCARDALQGMLKGVRVMQCSADALEQYCLRWRKCNCDDDPVDQIAVELWLEICLPAWRTRATSRTRSLRHEAGASQEGSGGESQRK